MKRRGPAIADKKGQEVEGQKDEGQEDEGQEDEAEEEERTDNGKLCVLSVSYFEYEWYNASWAGGIS